MIKRSVIILFALAIAFVPVKGASDSQDVDVNWTLSGCWIDLDVSNNFLIAPTLGSSYNIWQWSPGDTIGAGPHEVTVKTSCKGYDLSVKTTGLDKPAGHKSQWDSEDAYQDFELKAEVTPSAVNSQIQNYENFTSIGTDKTILSTNNARTTHTDMFYQYNIDKNDVAGDYTMNLTYTASSE